MAFRRMSKSVSSLVRLSKSAHVISPPANSSSQFCNNDPFRIPMAFLLRNSSSYSSPKGDQFKYQQGLNSRKAQSQHPQPQPQTRNRTTILARLQESFKAEGMPTPALGLGLAGAIPFVLLTPPSCRELSQLMPWKPKRLMVLSYYLFLVVLTGALQWFALMVHMECYTVTTCMVCLIIITNSKDDRVDCLFYTGLCCRYLVFIVYAVASMVSSA